LGRLNPVVEPKQEIVLSDAFSAETDNNLANRDIGDPLFLRTPERAAMASDLEQLLKVVARLRIDAENERLDGRIDDLRPDDRRSG
jgi:hypothetical protein